MAQDYKTRLTADTSQHDNALKRSAQQVYQYKKKTEDARKSISNLASGIGKFAGALGLAYSGMEVFNMAIKSSEPLTDKFGRNMEVAKSSVTAFINSFMNGSFESCISKLDKIAEAARNAYNALDQLGTNKMWANLGLMDIDAQIAGVKAAIAGGDNSQATAQKLETLIKQRTNIVEGLNADTQQAVKTSIIKMLGEFNSDLSGLVAGLTDEEYKQVEYLLKRIGKSGNPHEAIQRYAQSYHRQGGTGRKERNPNNGQWEEVWHNESAKRIYTILSNIENVSEEQLRPIIALLEEQMQRTQQNNQITAKVKKMGNAIKSDKPSKKEEEEIIPEGSIAALEKRLSELKNSFRNAITDEARENIKKEIDGVQTELDRLNGKEVEIKPVIPDGSIAYLEQKLKDLRNQFENTPDAELRIKLMADMSELERQLKDMQTTEAEKAAEALTKRLQDMQDEAQATASAFDAMGNVFTNLGSCMDETAQQFLSGVGSIISSIGAVMPQIASLIAAEEGEAMASGLAGAAKVEPWPAKVAAIASIVAQILGVIGTIASISKFADGGIIGGATSIGDYNLARVNSGEMILNNRQQQHLFNLLNGGTQAHDNSNGGNVTFTIHGADLQGTLNNYNRKTGRVR